MTHLDPRDDYPDAKADGDRRFHVLGALRKPNRAFRAWIEGSPRRSISPNGRLAATARVETVASAPGGGRYLSRPQLRPPAGKEVGRWKILVCDADVGWKQFRYPCRVDGEPTVVEENGRRVEAGPLQVLPDRKIVPKRLANQYARSGAEFDHVPHVMRWFVACWKEAVAKRPFPLRATIQLHDVNKPTRLSSGERRR